MEKDNLSNSELDVILDYQNLSLEEIIVEIKNLIESNNPFLVTKNVNELKSIFYSKLSKQTVAHNHLHLHPMIKLL